MAETITEPRAGEVWRDDFSQHASLNLEMTLFPLLSPFLENQMQGSDL